MTADAVAASLLAAPKPNEGGWEAPLSFTVHVESPTGRRLQLEPWAWTAVISAPLLF